MNPDAVRAYYASFGEREWRDWRVRTMAQSSSQLPVGRLPHTCRPMHAYLISVVDLDATQSGWRSAVIMSVWPICVLNCFLLLVPR